MRFLALIIYTCTLPNPVFPSTKKCARQDKRSGGVEGRGTPPNSLSLACELCLAYHNCSHLMKLEPP